MNKLISACHHFMKDCGFPYAFCGGYALELFLNKELRPHSDIDITVFKENINDCLDFMVNRGWDVYEPKSDWCDNKKSRNYLRPIHSNEKGITELVSLWAIKPSCSLIELDQKSGEEHRYTYEILDEVQRHFDFLEIVVNEQKEGQFVLDSFSSQGKHITRELDKAILYNDEGIPYLAPEVKLLMISHPAYLASDYHKVKNRIDFDSTVPFLPKEKRDWLIHALKTAYPGGHERLEQIIKYGE